MNKVILKKYYKIEFELKSPLTLGCGSNEETDSDVLLDSNGEPFIPGSSLAGIYRSLLDDAVAEKYFGKKLVKKQSSAGETTEFEDIDESHIIVYDAVFKKDFDEKDEPFIGKRDMVALDKYKVAVPGAKFDFQMVEPGISFVTYIEQTIYDDDFEKNDNLLAPILKKWKEEGLSFGSKTMRGFGKTKAIKLGEKKFAFPDNAVEWIDFDIYSDREWDNCDLGDITLNQSSWTMTLTLNQKGGLSIREYSTRKGEADYEQMKLGSRLDKPVAVIPGTSWAGAFRAQMKKLGMTEDQAKIVFGTVKTRKTGPQEKAAHRSHISFSESYIENGTDIVYSRNAIDRFTGGTVDGALYMESTRYNGNAICLTIGIDDLEARKLAAPYLAAAILDLHAGYMAVGGLTSVGRGLFEIIKVNDSDFIPDYKALRNKIEEDK